jgi:hypothetical protein
MFASSGFAGAAPSGSVHASGWFACASAATPDTTASHDVARLFTLGGTLLAGAVVDGGGRFAFEAPVPHGYGGDFVLEARWHGCWMVRTARLDDAVAVTPESLDMQRYDLDNLPVRITKSNALAARNAAVPPPSMLAEMAERQNRYNQESGNLCQNCGAGPAVSPPDPHDVRARP